MDVSVVIPVLNRKALMRHTLECIRRSSIWPVRILAVDNGSTDGTLEMLESYAASCPQLTVLQESERNAAAARNLGLSHVSSEWVYFFDSDDEFTELPCHWDTSSDLIAIPVTQKVNGHASVRRYKPVNDPAVHITNSMLNTPSMIFRTSWLKEIGGWNSSCTIWDDWELGARALMASPRMQWIEGKSFHLINVHDDSITGPSFKSRYRKQLDTLKIVSDEAAQCPSPVRDRCLKALLLRTFILSGKLLDEGDRKAAQECHRFISETFPGKPDGYRLGRFLEWFTSMGARGAWQIALRSIK